MVHFEVTDVIRTVKYCNFSSYIMKLQYLKCILTRFFFQKSKLRKPSFHMRFTNPALSASWRIYIFFNILLQIEKQNDNSCKYGNIGCEEFMGGIQNQVSHEVLINRTQNCIVSFLTLLDFYRLKLKLLFKCSLQFLTDKKPNSFFSQIHTIVRFCGPQIL